MKLIDNNMKYFRDTLPDAMARLVLKATEVRQLARDDQGLRDLGEEMQTLREDLVKWCSDQTWVLGRLKKRALQ